VAKQRHLTNAPITEALISFQVRQDLEQISARHEEFVMRLGTGYYRKGDITQGTFQVALTDGQSLHDSIRADSKRVGVRLHSQDERYVIQVTQAGLTLSRLEPYENWTVIRDEMRRLWEIYCGVFLPEMITRVALRYLNTILIVVGPQTRLEQIFTRAPTEPEGMSDQLSSFLNRCVIEDPPSRASVVVTLASQTAAPSSTLPVILDIEAFRHADFPIGGEEVWNYLGRLRALKNAAFFGSLTEDKIRQYE
jgi:uncharacterized protein (TIGR04255 family)